MESTSTAIMQVNPESRWWQIRDVAMPALYAQDFDLVNIILSKWLGGESLCEVRMKDEPPLKGMFWGFYWTMFEDGQSLVEFNSTILDFRTHKQAADWIRIIPFLVAVSKLKPRTYGRTIVWWADFATLPGLAFCTKADNVLLIPDMEFVTHNGYQSFRDAVPSMPRWEDRKNIALWRGKLWTNISPGGWKNQLRTKLCEMTLLRENAVLLDAAFSECPKDVYDKVTEAGLLRETILPEKMADFKYQIDIDGYGNAWSGLFRKLISGSAVLKVMSDYRQWYYDRLIPFQNFVPVHPDMRDLLPLIRWLQSNDEAARKIGENGRKLAMSMSYDAEVLAAKPTIDRALRENLGWPK